MNYESSSKYPILILHGWGITGEKYEKLKDLFEKSGFAVFAPDMPGFDKNNSPKKELFLDDYVEFVKEFIKKKKLKKVILLGHSFGGRVAAKLASQHPNLVEKLILSGAPLIKQPLSFKKKLAFGVSKVGKKVTPKFASNLARKILYRSIGEWDYYKAGNLQKTFQNIIAEDLSPLLSSISVPTLLIWGSQDSFVSKTIGKEIAGRIDKASYKEIAQGTHRIPYEEPEKFFEAAKLFLSK
jgi:pimeloyl-ACP methyl ester carboxylesterase